MRFASLGNTEAGPGCPDVPWSVEVLGPPGSISPALNPTQQDKQSGGWWTGLCLQPPGVFPA